MILSKTLKKNNIIINAKSSNKWDLIEEMLELAVKNSQVKKEDSEGLKSALFDREKSMSTGIGRGVAIPHCTTEAIDDVVIEMAFCENGVDFQSIDNEPVHIAIFLLVPKNKLRQHIKTLADIAKIMNNEDLRKKLLTIKKPETVIKTIREYESSSN